MTLDLGTVPTYENPPPPPPTETKPIKSVASHTRTPVAKITQTDAFNYMSYHFICKRGIRPARTEQFLVCIVLGTILGGGGRGRRWRGRGWGHTHIYMWIVASSRASLCLKGTPTLCCPGLATKVGEDVSHLGTEKEWSNGLPWRLHYLKRPARVDAVWICQQFYYHWA